MRQETGREQPAGKRDRVWVVWGNELLNTVNCNAQTQRMRQAVPVRERPVRGREEEEKKALTQCAMCVPVLLSHRQCRTAEHGGHMPSSAVSWA